jgi:hypothetical protein
MYESPSITTSWFVAGTQDWPPLSPPPELLLELLDIPELLPELLPEPLPDPPSGLVPELLPELLLV